MQIDLQKVLFLGAAAKKDPFLTAFQQAGNVQFIGTKVSFTDLLHSDFNDVLQAIRILQQHEVPQTTEVVIVDPLSFSKDVINDHQRLETCKEELKAVREQLSLIAPFGAIPLDAITSIEEQTHLYFRLWKSLKKRNAEAKCQHLILASEDAHHHYFVSITADTFLPPPGVENIPLSDELATLPATQASLIGEIERLEEQLKQRSCLIDSLKASLVARVNETKRQRAAEEAAAPLDNRLFAMTGWVPQTQLEQTLALAHSLDIFTELLPTLPNEVPPTCLENQDTGKIGEDLVNIYDTPSHTDADPSIWVLGFFSLFFAMIVGDAGYGLVFLATALYLRQKTRLSSSPMQRFVKLVALLGGACVVWGLFTHSFFSITLSPTNPLRASSPLTYLVKQQARYHMDINDATYERWVSLHNGIPPSSVDEFLYTSPSPSTEPLYGSMADGIMLELALVIGALHIILGICRYLTRNIANAGWLLCIVGGYMYFAHFLHAPSMIYYLFHIDPPTGASIGIELLAAGFLFTAATSIMKNGIADLFFVIMGAVSVFADVLSYLRLYALGLSGAIVSGMINELASAFPFVIAVTLIVLSHAINIVLSIVGGVIHGLRLNFLEWYHYSFEGGGKPFSPLTLETYK